ncbi:MAG TPA: amidohydrolase family protein [Acidimicrobiales bacterium]|nr:amidohydrolase family protein [Acidimicrobiales bacterium]
MPELGCKVVDGDGHVVEPVTLWSDRMDQARWGDWIPHVDPGTGGLLVGGVHRGRGEADLGRISELIGIPEEEIAARFAETNASLGREGGKDPRARLVDMDAAGIDVAVLYPSSAMFFGPVDPIPALHDPEFVLACQQAYNDWLAEYCSADPERLFGIAAVPLQDIDLAIGEAQRAVGDLGMRGVFIRPSAYIDELPFSHPVYDPFWAALQELGVPVSLHPAVHVDTPGACRKFGLVRDDPSLIVTNVAVSPIYGGSGLGQAVGNAVDMIVSMGRLLMGGVCERFPELTFIFLESGGGWCATQLQRMDHQVEEFGLERHWLTMPPSEYFRRQCYVSFDPDEWNLAASAEWIGAERILWASDYPHPEYKDDVLDELKASLAPLDEAKQRRIIGENAVTAYRLPIGVSA